MKIEHGTGSIESVSLAGVMRGVVDGRFREGKGTYAQLLALRAAKVLCSHRVDLRDAIRELVAFCLVWLEQLDDEAK